MPEAKKKKITLKVEGGCIVLGGKEIRQHDIDNNPALYDWLLSVSDNHKDQFTVSDVADEEEEEH